MEVTITVDEAKTYCLGIGLIIYDGKVPTCIKGDANAVVKVRCSNGTICCERINPNLWDYAVPLSVEDKKDMLERIFNYVRKIAFDYKREILFKYSSSERILISFNEKSYLFTPDRDGYKRCLHLLWDIIDQAEKERRC